MSKLKMYSPPTEAEIEEFADRHLQPWSSKDGEVVARTCPFCNGGENGDTNTFYISYQTGQYMCHRGKCGAKGGWIALLRHFGEAAGIASVSKQFTPISATPLPRTPEIDSYFSQRGISIATLDRFQIGATRDGNIVFPFYIEGDLIYLKYRTPVLGVTKRKEWAQKGSPPVLFGMDLCDASFPLVITEGMLDSLSCAEAGIPNAVSVPTGCENFDWIEPCWSWLENFKRIILFGDNDEPGRKMVAKLTKRLGEDRVWIVDDYPEGCKDANDILVKCGKDVLVQSYKSAKEVPITGMLDLSDVQEVDPTTVPRIKTFIPALDESINGLEMGGITVFTGKRYCPAGR